MPAIRADDLRKRYGDVAALDGLNVEVPHGELYGFLGPNGAGKTTTLRVLTGQLVPDSGSAEVLGVNPATDPVEVRRRVGILPEQGSPPSFLTPREYLQFVGRVRGMDESVVAERTDAWADRLGFAGKLDTLATDLSRGQAQKAMVAAAFLHEPDLVFIDEPLANLDPIVQERLKRYLTDYAGNNTIFVSTHDIDVAEELCTRVGIVADGRVVSEIDVADLDEPLLDAFLAAVDAAGARDTPRRERTTGDGTPRRERSTGDGTPHREDT
ncbi:ABC transporter ATP-binding protein [Halorubrum gandharaense]